jgi:hypothetical protein
MQKQNSDLSDRSAGTELGFSCLVSMAYQNRHKAASSQNRTIVRVVESRQSASIAPELLAKFKKGDTQ